MQPVKAQLSSAATTERLDLCQSNDVIDKFNQPLSPVFSHVSGTNMSRFVFWVAPFRRLSAGLERPRGLRCRGRRGTARAMERPTAITAPELCARKGSTAIVPRYSAQIWTDQYLQSPAVRRPQDLRFDLDQSPRRAARQIGPRPMPSPATGEVGVDERF